MLKVVARQAAKKFGFDLVRATDPYCTAIYEKICDRETLDRKPFINIGSGSFWHPYWTNVDYVSEWYKDVQRDVVHFDIMDTKPLPFEDGSIKVAYTSHTIEHVKDDAVSRLFKEVRRVLEPDGVFRITTGPDAETDFRALMRGDASWFYWDEAYVKPGSYEHLFRAPATSVPLEERWLHHVASELAPNDKVDGLKYNAKEIRKIISDLGFEGALNFFTSKTKFQPERIGNHASWWTHDKVMRYLTEVGFATVYRSGYRQSVSPLLRNSDLFDSTHPQMSLYVEAVATAN